jgi:hypothetical protein
LRLQFEDQHYLDLDPDPAFQFNADLHPHPDPALLQSDGNLRPLVYTLPGSSLSLQASIVSVYGTPRLYFECLKLFNFDFNADPDAFFPSNSDPDPYLDPALKKISMRIRIGSATVFLTMFC